MVAAANIVRSDRTPSDRTPAVGLPIMGIGSYIGHIERSSAMTRGNATRMLGIVLSLVIGGSSPAFARDVCVDWAGVGPVVFKKVKRLRPGGAVPLDGLWKSPLGFTVPISGTALMQSDGSIRFGFRAFSMLPEGVVGYANTTVTMKAADETYAGTGVWENDPGDTTPDGTVVFTSIDCATVGSF